MFIYSWKVFKYISDPGAVTSIVVIWKNNPQSEKNIMMDKTDKKLEHFLNKQTKIPNLWPDLMHVYSEINSTSFVGN